MSESKKSTKKEEPIVIVDDDKDIDYSDIPATDEEFWKGARVVQYVLKKEPITIRLDDDILAWFKKTSKGKGYQTYINAVLRSYMKAHKN